jgi:hypothetical protein
MLVEGGSGSLRRAIRSCRNPHGVGIVFTRVCLEA